MLDPAIKYGGGEERVRELLARASEGVALEELAERHLADLLANSPPQDQLPEDFRQEIAVNRERLSSCKRQLTELLAELIAGI